MNAALSEFVGSFHTSQVKRLEVLLSVLDARRLDRGDYDLCCTLADAIAHITQKDLSKFFWLLDDLQRNALVWIVATVCSIETLNHLVSCTIRQTEIDQRINERTSELTTRAAQLDQRKIELDQRETSLVQRENAASDSLFKLSRQLYNMAVGS